MQTQFRDASYCKPMIRHTSTIAGISYTYPVRCQEGMSIRGQYDVRGARSDVHARGMGFSLHDIDP